MRTKLAVLIALFALTANAPVMALQSSDMSDGERAEVFIPDAPMNIVPSAAIIPVSRTDLNQSQRGESQIDDAMSDPGVLFPETSKVDTGPANPFQGGDAGR